MVEGRCNPLLSLFTQAIQDGVQRVIHESVSPEDDT